MKRILLVAPVLFLAASLVWGSDIVEKREKISGDITKHPSSSALDVIVQYRHTPLSRNYEHATKSGGAITRKMHLINAAAFHVRASALARLAADPDVVYVSPDRLLHSTADSSQTLDYYPLAVNAQVAIGDGYVGTGIAVAVIDSGIIDIPDLHGANYRVVFSQNFVGGTSGSANDTYGHGSHVAGIIGGNGNNSTGSSYLYSFKGIAPNVNLLNFRVLDQNGAGTDSQVISAIQMAIQLKNKYNIRVINLSLGRPVYESYTLDPLCQAVEQAWKAGIVVVVAAGNYGRDNSVGEQGYGTITAPGNDPYVITAGAMKTMGTSSSADDLIASYSSKGPTGIDHVLKPDLVAPGNRMISLYTAGLTLPKQFPGNEIPYSLYQTNGNSTASSTYYRLSGTSMAAAVVSGAIADLLQVQPQLTPDQIKARLMKTASKNFPYSSSTPDPSSGVTYTDYYDAFTVGAGYLDIQAALNNTDLVPVGYTALSPSVSFDSSKQTVTFISGSSAVWGNSAAWGKFCRLGKQCYVGQ